LPLSTAQAKQRSTDLEAQLKEAQAAAAAETAASAAGRDAGLPLRQQLL